MSGVLLLGLVAINSVLFVAVLVFSVRLVLTTRSAAVRAVAVSLALAALGVLLGAVQRLGLDAVEAGWLPESTSRFWLVPFHAAISSVTLIFGLMTLVRVRQGLALVERGDRVVAVLTERTPLRPAVSDVRLTARELDIVELIASGLVSDRELATALFISPATAATHVRNVMRKAGVSTRTALMLWAQPSERRPLPGRTPTQRD